MAGQISTIASGTLIDQAILSNIITNVNEIASSQYTSTSFLANGLDTPQVALQNGQWVVATIYEKAEVTPKKSVNSATTGIVNFGTSFATKPMISATIYSSNSSLIIDNIFSTVIITEVGLDYFKYKVLFSPSNQDNNPSTSFGILFMAIGKAKL